MEEAGFIPLDDTKPFESNNASGKGWYLISSSVTPVMGKTPGGLPENQRERYH